jgi:hypothetical protein
MNTRPDSSADALVEAQRAGVDLDLIDTNLALTVKERWQQHDGALRLILKLESGKKARDAGLQSTDRQADGRRI